MDGHCGIRQGCSRAWQAASARPVLTAAAGAVHDIHDNHLHHFVCMVHVFVDRYAALVAAKGGPFARSAWGCGQLWQCDCASRPVASHVLLSGSFPPAVQARPFWTCAVAVHARVLGQPIVPGVCPVESIVCAAGAARAAVL